MRWLHPTLAGLKPGLNTLAFLNALYILSKMIEAEIICLQLSFFLG